MIIIAYLCCVIGATTLPQPQPQPQAHRELCSAQLCAAACGNTVTSTGTAHALITTLPNDLAIHAVAPRDQRLRWDCLGGNEDMVETAGAASFNPEHCLRDGNGGQAHAIENAQRIAGVRCTHHTAAYCMDTTTAATGSCVCRHIHCGPARHGDTA